MADTILKIKLSYVGSLADEHQLDLYDAAQGLVGFQRSLALTTHLILNNEIITQAPSLNGAEIRALPPHAGCWEIWAAIVVTGGALYKITTAPRSTPLGHVIVSAYDYVISHILGFHVDYEKTLGQQFKEAREQDSDIKIIDATRFDSLAEKCEVAVREMHRPIVKSHSATAARITAVFSGGEKKIGSDLTAETHEHIYETIQSETVDRFDAWVSSYNRNTFKGRVYIPEFNRPIPFELGDTVRDDASVNLITTSLNKNSVNREQWLGQLEIEAFQRTSKSGRLKGLLVVSVQQSGRVD